MGANGKGNGKKEGKGPAPEPVQADGKAKNGKAHAALSAEGAPPEEEGTAGASEEEGAPGSGREEGAAPQAAAGEAAGEGASTGEAAAQAAQAEQKPAPADGPRGAAWGHPFARFEARWTVLESRLLTFVLLWQIVSLVSWVLLNGLSESVATGAGAVFRAVLLAAAAGLGAWRFGKGLPEERRRDRTLVAAAAAIGVVLLWRTAAVRGAGGLDRAVFKYFDNVKGWLQEGSTLTLLGGLRGLGTRLTLWLALLGGSLATASGKHIHVDVIFRFLPKKMRLPVSLLNYVVAATVCFAGVWGFFDHIAIEAYGSKADDRAAVKIDNALHHLGDHAFFTRKQIGLDLRSLPHVLRGQRYDQWMTAADWNEWVDGAGFESRWAPDKVKNMHIPEGTHPPFVVSPDGETTRSALAHTLGLVFPFGLLAIALRFLLRALLTLSGHFVADPDEAHKEEIGQGGAAAREGGA